MAVSLDGLTLAVGAPREDGSARTIDGPPDEARTDSGAVYMFSLDGGVWTQRSYLKASSGEAGGGFGRALSLSADGRRLAASAMAWDDMAGEVHLFKREGGSWREQTRVQAPDPAGQQGFGAGLGFAGDGQSLAVGSGAPATAAAYLY